MSMRTWKDLQIDNGSIYLNEIDSYRLTLNTNNVDIAVHHAQFSQNAINLQYYYTAILLLNG